MSRITADTALPHGMQEELRIEISQVLLPALTALGVLLIWSSEAARWPWSLELVGLILLVVPLLALSLLRRSYRAASGLLVLGCLVATLLALRWFPAGTDPALLALSVGLAALLINAGAGLAVAVVGTAAVLWGAALPSAPAESVRLSSLAVIWGVEALMWASSRFNGRAMGSLWSSYVRMRQLLEDAREQRLDLKQTQADLLHANSELARLSERLAWLNQVAQEARQAKEQFVANVSHELRTPLNMIIGFTQIISETPDAYGGALPPALLADIDVILRNSKHLAGLVDDVLDLAQADAQRMSLDKEWLSLPEVCREAVVAVRPLFESKGLYLQLDVPEDLPALYGDRTRIRQVLLNLASNAGRFTERGGVRIGTRLESGAVVISVADTGPGIAPEQQQRVFEPFQQADASIRRRLGGTGLGLSISNRFVEMHGGRMWLESQPGRGSTFYFSLPLPEAVAPAGGGNAVRWLSPEYEYRGRTRRSKAPTPATPPRLVVLEPGNSAQRLLRHHLQEVELVAARTPEQALEEIRRSPAQALIVNDPAAVRADSALPNACAELPYGTPVIACWLPGLEEAAAQLGVARYLVKPVLRETLCEALDSLGQDIETVLIADDEPEVLQLMVRLLTSLGKGYRALRAQDGERALQLLRERRPDVMLLDLIMPGLDGQQVLREKAQDPAVRDIPVFAFTAQDPVGGPAIGSSFVLTRGGGLSARDLLACLRIWSGAISPLGPSGGPAQPGAPAE